MDPIEPRRPPVATTLDDPVDPPGRAAPASVRAAEGAVVGAAMRSRSAAEAAAEIVQPGDFADNRCRLVFEAIVGLVNDGAPVDETSVFAELGRRCTLMAVGGGPALLTLAERAPVGAQVTYFARIVARDAVRRRVHEAGQYAMQVTSRPDFDPDADVDLIRKTLDQAATVMFGDEPPAVGDVLLDVLDELERPLTSGDLLPPPYMDLEMLIPGLQPGQLIVIGARPSIGKTLTALDCARTAAIGLGSPTLMFSLEMSHAEITHRLLAAEASVELKHFVEHKLTDDDWNRIFKVQDRVQAAPLFIDDKPDCTIGRIRSRLRSMTRRGGCRLVIVDYLGLMQLPRAESRERAVAETTRSLKMLAKEFQVPIMLLAQLNRASEHRADRKPMLSDLRESGGIEADADAVILLHREDFYDKETPRAGELDLIVAKNRHGATGTAVVAFQGMYGRSRDLYRER